MKKTCFQCKYYDLNRHICKDKKIYVDKMNITEIVCRYNENAILFHKAYKMKREKK